jgi:hypothetical protein
MERGEHQGREDVRTAAIAEQNRLIRESLALKTAEYRRRFSATENGRQSLLKMVERLEQEVRMLQAERGNVAA